MIKVFKVATLLHIILLYSFTLSLYSGGDYLPDSKAAKNPTHTDYHAVASTSIICHTSETSNILESIQHLFASLKYNPSDPFLFRAYSLEKTILNKDVQYLSLSKDFSVSCDSKIIIYPFHSFL